MINNTIPEIFTFLTNTYGQFSSSQLKERERVINDIVYDPSQNIDSDFKKITEFQDPACYYKIQKQTRNSLPTPTYASKNRPIPHNSKRVEYQTLR